MFCLLIFLCIAGYSATPVPSTETDLRRDHRPLKSKGSSCASIEVAGLNTSNTPQLQHFGSFLWGTQLPSSPKPIDTYRSPNPEHAGSSTSLIYPCPTTPMGTFFSTGDRWCSSPTASTFSLNGQPLDTSDLAKDPTPSDPHLVPQVNCRIVDQFPSEQKIHWHAKTADERKESAEQLRKFFYAPQEAYQKILDWIGKNTTFGSRVSVTTFSGSLFLGEDLRPYEPYSVLLRMVLFLGMLYQKPGDDASPEWCDLTKIYSAICSGKKHGGFITSHYANPISVIISLIYQISAHTNMEPKILFEQNGSPTPQSELMALANGNILITLPGLSHQYGGKKAVHDIFTNISVTLTTCFLADVVNGSQIERLEAQNFSAGGSTFSRAFWFLMCMCSLPTAQGSCLTHFASSFLDWAYDTRDPSFKTLSFKVKKENIVQLKLAIACQRMLGPYVQFSDPLFPSSGDIRPPLFQKIKDLLEPLKAHTGHVIELLNHAPSIESIGGITYATPSDWWKEDSPHQVKGEQFKRYLVQVYGFIFANIYQKFTDQVQKTTFNPPVIPRNMFINCVTGPAPALFVMATSNRLLWVVFPTMDAILSVDRYIDYRILLQTFTHSVDYVLRELQEGAQRVCPANPFFSALTTAVHPMKLWRAQPQKRRASSLAKTVVRAAQPPRDAD